MKKIPLTRGQYALVDDGDFELVSQYKWSAHRNKFNNYSARAFYKGHNKFIYMHRLIMNAKDEEVVDHIDHNTLDNRRSNLRICTVGQNNINHGRIRSDNKSGFMGVCKHKNRWQAYIYYNHRCYNCGRFKTPEEAAAARDRFAKILHGEFATLNFDKK
jgi:HNH endonuclease